MKINLETKNNYCLCVVPKKSTVSLIFTKQTKFCVCNPLLLNNTGNSPVKSYKLRWQLFSLDVNYDNGSKLKQLWLKLI